MIKDFSSKWGYYWIFTQWIVWRSANKDIPNLLSDVHSHKKILQSWEITEKEGPSEETLFPLAKCGNIFSCRLSFSHSRGMHVAGSISLAKPSENGLMQSRHSNEMYNDNKPKMLATYKTYLNCSSVMSFALHWQNPGLSLSHLSTKQCRVTRGTRF